MERGCLRLGRADADPESDESARTDTVAAGNGFVDGCDALNEGLERLSPFANRDE